MRPGKTALPRANSGVPGGMNKKLLLLVVPLLAACGATQAGGTGAPQNAAGAYAPSRAAAGASSGAAAPSTAQGGLSFTEKGAATAPSQPSSAPVPPLPSGQHLELAATVDVQMKHGRFDDGLNSIIAIVSSEHGYLASSDAGGVSESGLHGGTFTFEVPADNYQDTLDRVRGVGKVLGLHSSSKSHDSEYVDLQSRLKSAQLQLDAFNALLAKATSITDIITIEQQIGQVQQQIEQYQGQLNYLDSITQYSTVTAVLSEAGAAPAPRPVADRWGFGGSFQQVLRNLASIGNALILVLGTLLPFLILGVAAFVTRRRWLPALARP